MPHKKVIILDGTRPGDKHLNAILALLTEELECQGTKIQTFTLRNIQFNHCIGCFNCWIKTPGKCIHTDAGAEIIQSILHSDTLILFTPVIFGGYSSELKKITERFLPIVLPFFRQVHGETHHPPRYPTLSRFLGIGLHPHPLNKESDCFKKLVGRNAINISPTSYAAEVFNSMNTPELLRSQFQELLSRTDAPPWRKEMTKLLRNPPAAPKISTGNRRALLIIGSPKIKSPSTSVILGGHILKKIKQYGWQTELLTLKQNLRNEKEQCALCSAIDRADTILLASPLYCDTLPFLVTQALETIASHRKTIKNAQPKNLTAIINSGFPESYQNAVALAICQNFAFECGMTWLGGLAMGAGEGLLSGQPATGFKGLYGVKRPPLYHINRALNITAAALSAGHPIPEKAVRLIARKPFPIISFDTWRWVYTKISKRLWEKEAGKNGLHKEKLFDRPHAKQGYKK
jgi:multimeric flavodoxin WrbA